MYKLTRHGEMWKAWGSLREEAPSAELYAQDISENEVRLRCGEMMLKMSWVSQPKLGHSAACILC